MRILLLLLLVAVGARAEMFVGPTSLTNHFFVASNETICTRTTFGAAGYAGLIQSGSTNWFPLLNGLGDGGSYYLSGEAELLVTNLAAIQFARITNFPVHQLILGFGDSTNILIPEGKSLRFLQRFGNLEVKLLYGTNSLPLQFYTSEISGPAMLSFTGYHPNTVNIWPYYFLEEAVVFPTAGYLQGPSGSFEILVEKSSNLRDWFPVMANQSSGEQKQFFRMRLTR